VHPELDPSIRDYYDRGQEASRLLGGVADGPLELARTKELIVRHLPEGSLEFIDIGGGPGVYAKWLVELGHSVHVVDPIETHVEQARAADRRITAAVGDARALDRPDESVDVALLLGPLYHLPEPADRRRALEEARRVLRQGGWLFAAAISRFAALLDLLVNSDRLADPDVQRILSDCVNTGTLRGGEAELGFATAYCHLPPELEEDVTGVGFTDTAVYGIEGVAFTPPDIREQWANPERREALLVAARLTESEPSILGASSHLLAVARKPGGASG
jgi:SAM-dependent methyltransferase